MRKIPQRFLLSYSNKTAVSTSRNIINAFTSLLHPSNYPLMSAIHKRNYMLCVAASCKEVMVPYKAATFGMTEATKYSCYLGCSGREMCYLQSCSIKETIKYRLCLNNVCKVWSVRASSPSAKNINEKNCLLISTLVHGQ